MSIISFANAARRSLPVLTCLYGESGSGKSLSALRMARGLAGPTGRIGMIDTESGRGLLYADDKLVAGYEHAELTPPYTPERYIEALDAAEAAKFDVLVLDQASSEWEGLGGVLESAEDGRSSNGQPLKGLVKWAAPKARHKRFVQRLVTTHQHIIVCLRAKERMKQVGDKIVSDGFVSIQDRRFVYEMTLQLFLPRRDDKPRGVPVVEKIHGDLVAAFPADRQIDVKTGEMIRQWIDGGAPVDRAFESLKRRGEQVAADGSEALKAWWSALGRADKLSMQPHMSNLKSVAAEADKNEPGADGEGGQPTGEQTGGTGDQLDDPFAERPAA